MAVDYGHPILECVSRAAILNVTLAHLKGAKDLGTILPTPPIEIHYATSTIVIWPLFLECCVYGCGPRKVENGCFGGFFLTDDQF